MAFVSNYNLVDEPWIPVVMKTGQERQMGLAEVFAQLDSIADLALSAYRYVALMRLLQCILYAAQKDPEVSRPAWETRVQDSAKYLKRWHDSFSLYHIRHPFLQIFDLQIQSDKTPCSIAALDLAQRNSREFALFSQDEVAQENKDIALNLLTYQCFALRENIPVLKHETRFTDEVADGALCSAGSMAHTFLLGDTLAETLQFNTPLPVTFAPLYEPIFGQLWFGRPVWELEIPHQFQESVKTFLGRLVPLTRFIRIKDNVLLCGAGLTYPRFDNRANHYLAEPSATVVKARRDGVTVEEVLSLKEGVSPWRDWEYLFAGDMSEADVAGPLALRVLKKEAPEKLPQRLRVLGLIVKDGKVLDSVDETYPLPLLLYDKGVYLDFAEKIEEAESWATQLGRALFAYAHGVDARIADIELTKGFRFNNMDVRDLLIVRKDSGMLFWKEVERKLYLLYAIFEASGKNQREAFARAWGNHLRASALFAYEAVASDATTRQKKAYELGLKELNF